MKRRGFTLIELLVVIAIIALLLAIMVPSLRIAKEYAAAAVCLTNQKNLCLAWTMYAEDNETFLVGGSTYYGGSNGTPYRWVEPPLNKDTDNPEKTGTASFISMETRINGIRAGKLFPYTQDPKLYHCPADRTFVTEEEPYAAYRSYAISGLMNGEHFKSRKNPPGGIYASIDSEYVTTTGKKLRVATKMGQISNPGSKIVFMEEDIRNKDPKQEWNKGGFVLISGDPSDLNSWWDAPAGFHNDSSTIGYADGHTERLRWHDPRTLRLIELGKGVQPVYQPGNEDLQLLIRGYFPTL